MRILISLIGLLGFSLAAQEMKLGEIRSTFQKSASSEVSCKFLMDALAKYDALNDPKLAAYRACATMMMSNYVLNPISKLSHFNSGKELLEKCVQADKTSIEIRYLRFSIQSKSPRFLGYTQSILTDKHILLACIVDLRDLQLKKMIIDFLKTSQELTEFEKQKIGV